LDDIFYGISIESQNLGSIYRIYKSGAAYLKGRFPLSANFNKIEGTTCFMMNGGTIYDPETKVLVLHYSAGSKGMFLEQIDINTGKIYRHSYYPYDFVSPVLSPDFQKVYSLELMQTPPYSKWLAELDVSTGVYKRFPDLDYFYFYDNEATLQYSSGTGIYYTIMSKNISSSDNLLGIDITTGKLVTQPPLQEVMWNILFAN